MLNGCPFGGDCTECPHNNGSVVCHCLGITEETLVSALVTLELRTVREVRQYTGAGAGCTACHRKIQNYIDAYSPSSSPEICSAR
jgi:NifU-like protein